MKTPKTPLITCTPKQLPKELLEAAAATAARINPINHPRMERVGLRAGFAPTRMEIAIMTATYWGTGGVHLTVGFLDNPEVALRKRILLHMNAWAKSANVKFTYTTGHADVRISRVGGKDGGYWSYVGTDIKHIPADEATMNLEAFTMSTPESEFHRVVRHETGHTLGSPHEHMRRALVALIDPAKAIAFFGETQGWSPDEVRQQVLTPIEESSLRGTAPDPKSIMCYQIPGSITKNGKPIIGGKDIDKKDYAFMAVVYPKKSGNAPAKRKTAKRKTAKRAAKRSQTAKRSRKR